MKTIMMMCVLLVLSGCATANAPAPDGAARPVLMGGGAMIWRR